MLHPGSCKQSVPPALAIFHESTVAAMKSYFPDRQDAAQFLHLLNVWWTVSNSKNRYNSNNKLGDAAIAGDGKPQFLRAFANWLISWEAEKIECSEKFQLTAQTNGALVRTLQCHAAILDDLLESSAYDFVLMARLQSDPLEKRYGQYRQMSGGRFLVSLREVVCSENILKMKSLLKEGCDINEAKCNTPDVEHSLNLIDEKIRNISDDNLTLNQQSREVVVYVAGYISRQIMPYLQDCCSELLQGTCDDSSYLKILSRGGLKSPSQPLSDYVSQCFALLDATFDEIQRSFLPARVFAEQILSSNVVSTGFVCDDHEDMACRKINKIICNIFLNNERKRKTSSVIDDKVKVFKRLKREK